jgi:Mg-chelatase subunit ChlD
MSKEGLTEIVCVLDRSGSMECIIDDAIGGFNTFLQAQKDAEEGEARMSIAMFDDEYMMICESRDVQVVEDFTKKTYVPRGLTALNDAIGKTIMRMGEIFDQREEEEKPEKVIFVILTDGQENSSKEYDLQKVKKLIEQQQNDWNWEFIFLSSDLSAFEQGHMLGISATSRFSNSGKGTRSAYACMAKCVTNYRATGQIGDIDKEIK